MDPDSLAGSLLAARDARTPVVRLTSTLDLSVADAYRVQHAVVTRLVGRGEVPVGLKLGFTSESKIQEMGIDGPIAGVLTDRMALEDGAVVPTGGLIHPRIEPEIAFGVDLRRPGRIRAAAALEIIDSRFVAFDFAAADVIADNASGAFFAVGSWTEVDVSHEAALRDNEVSLLQDGVVMSRGRASDILGDPLRALEVARAIVHTHGVGVPHEVVLLAGAATAAIPLEAGRSYEARVDGVGSVGLTAAE